MTKYKFSIEQIFYSLFALAVVFAFCHLATVCFFADSEIWLLTLSQQTFTKAHLASIFYKWSFHVLTYAFSHHAPTEAAVYTYARIGYLAVALAAQVLIAYTFSVFAKDKKAALPVFIAIMTFSAFFNQGFRIRGDILSLFSHAVILLTVYKLLHARIRWWHYLWITAWNVVLVLSTPKSVYFYIAQFAFAISLYKYLKASRDYFRLIWLTHVLPVAAALAVALLTHVLPAPVDLVVPIHEAVDYFLKSFDKDLYNIEYWTIADFAHVIKVLVRSPIHTVVLFIGLLIYLSTSFRLKQKTVFSALNVYFGILFLCVVLHNQKFPFFLGTFGTPLIAFTFLAVYSTGRKFMGSYWSYASLAIISAMSVFCYLEYHSNKTYNNNAGQYRAIERFDAYVQAHPGLVYYDIIGILPRRTNIFMFIGPGEVARKQQIMEDLESRKPALVIFTFKFIFLEPEIRYYLTEKFISAEDNVWSRGDNISVLTHMQYFRQPITIDGQKYWHIPRAPLKHIYHLSHRRDITAETVPLKNGLKVKHDETPNGFAVPVKYLDIGQTDVDPIGFSGKPYRLFQYDTNF